MFHINKDITQLGTINLFPSHHKQGIGLKNSILRAIFLMEVYKSPFVALFYWKSIDEPE